MIGSGNLRFCSTLDRHRYVYKLSQAYLKIREAKISCIILYCENSSAWDYINGIQNWGLDLVQNFAYIFALKFGLTWSKIWPVIVTQDLNENLAQKIAQNCFKI